MGKTAHGRPYLQPHREDFSVFNRHLQKELLTREHPALVNADAAFNAGQAPPGPEFCPGGEAEKNEGQHREVPLTVEQGHGEEQADNGEHERGEEHA